MLLRWFEYSQIYHPTREHETRPELEKLVYEEVFFGNAPKLHGWFFPARTDSPRKHSAFLICHGNAGNISHRVDLAQTLLESGANIFLFDYRGYGRSEGQ